MTHALNKFLFSLHLWGTTGEVRLCSLPFSSKVEKTRHYLLLREKLEATLHAGQDALFKSNDISDFAKSPVLSHSPSSSPALDSPNQRQRELAAKVTAHLWFTPSFTTDFSRPGSFSFMFFLKNMKNCFHFPVSASADAHLQQGVQPGEQQCQWEQGEPQPRPSITQFVSPSEPTVYSFTFTKYLSPTLLLSSHSLLSHLFITLSCFFKNTSHFSSVFITTQQTWVNITDSCWLKRA